MLLVCLFKVLWLFTAALSYQWLVSLACCPLPAENHSSTHTQWTHAWGYQAEHRCLSRWEHLLQRGATSCFEGPASGLTRHWRRDSPRQGQDPLAAWGGAASATASATATPTASCLTGKLNINSRCVIAAWVTQLFSWPTFHQMCRASAAAAPSLSCP